METTAESLHNISEHLKWLINSLMLLIKALITAPKKKKKEGIQVKMETLKQEGMSLKLVEKILVLNF